MRGRGERENESRDISQEQNIWHRVSKFIPGESENFSNFESPDFRYGVSPRRRVPVSPCPLQAGISSKKTSGETA